MTDNVQITMTQDDYRAMFDKAQALEWIAENCSVDHWYDGHVAGCWDAGNDNPLLDWITEQQEPDHEPDYGAPTAGEVGDMAAKAYREGGR